MRPDFWAKGNRDKIAQVTQFHARHVIVKCYYYKQIIRFPRFSELCDKRGVSGTKPVVQKIKVERERLMRKCGIKEVSVIRSRWHEQKINFQTGEIEYEYMTRKQGCIGYWRGFGQHGRPANWIAAGKAEEYDVLFLLGQPRNPSKNNSTNRVSLSRNKFRYSC
jgi:hypothetical protein